MPVRTECTAAAAHKAACFGRDVTPLVSDPVGWIEQALSLKKFLMEYMSRRGRGAAFDSQCLSTPCRR